MTTTAYPRYVICSIPSGACQIIPVAPRFNQRPIPGGEVDTFDEAVAIRDRLNGLEYAIGDDVLALTGPFAGHVGEIDEIDLQECDEPYRVRFDMESDPVAWFPGSALMSTAVAQ